MSLYDLGVTAEEAKKDESFKVAPSGEYDFRVDSFKEKNTLKGRPMHVFMLSIINDPTNLGVNVFHNCVLPWENPESGQKESGGIGQLSRLVRCCGMKWEGTTYDPEALVGCTGRFVLDKKPKNEKVADPATGMTIYVPIANPDPEDDGDWSNEIKKFII